MKDDGRPLHSTLARLAAEMQRAREKFPSNEKLLAALTEEVGEVANALLEHGNSDEAREEALQVAGVALRIVEEGDADFDGWPPKKSDLVVPVSSAKLTVLASHSRLFSKHCRGRNALSVDEVRDLLREIAEMQVDRLRRTAQALSVQYEHDGDGPGDADDDADGKREGA